MFGVYLDMQRILIVLKTEIGKSHVKWVLGTSLKEAILIIHPLLMLTAEQVVCFLKGFDLFGAIEAHNIDNFGRAD